MNLATIKKLFLFFLSYCCFVSIVSANELVGLWKTIDDTTRQPKALIQIEENSDHTLSGRIIKLFSQTNQPPAVLCTHCEGEKKNQPLIGMVILEHLKQSKENEKAWINGQILDPKNGKNYHCNVQLLENGQKLQVRGYIGLPVFGRSQIWLKSQS